MERIIVIGNDNKFIVNVEAAIYKEGKFLIVKRSEEEDHAAGELALVGGKVEIETNDVIDNILEKTVKREIEEEVSIQVDDEMHYLESKFFVSETMNGVVDIVFLCKYKQGTARCNDLEEVAEVYWLSADEILNNEKTPYYLKDSIRKAMSCLNKK